MSKSYAGLTDIISIAPSYKICKYACRSILKKHTVQQQAMNSPNLLLTKQLIRVPSVCTRNELLG